MKRFIIPLLMLISLSACFEDKGAILAECRLKHETDPKIGQGNIEDADGVLLCMRAKGYILKPHNECAETESNMDYSNPSCYESTSSWRNIFSSQ